MTERRFIEEHFPVKEVGEYAVREKNATHGHLATMHPWWARLPLAVSRSIIYASLIPAVTDEKDIKSQKDVIADLAQWKSHLNEELISRARKHILEYNKTAPKILDPFSGGGSMPLEALRLGCETYASDYNPVANLIIRATIEYPFELKFHTRRQEMESQADPTLITIIKKYSRWVLAEAKKDLECFFPDDKDGEIYAYLWSRAIPCQNPRCGATIPLIRQFWLANKDNRKISLFPIVKEKNVRFKIIDDEKIPTDFDPKNGTILGGKATCLVCKYRMNGNKIKELFAEGKNSEIMNAVIVRSDKSRKLYRVASKNDLKIFEKTKSVLQKKQANFLKKYGIDPIPDEETPEGKGKGAERAFSVRLYGMNTYGELFNERQKLVLVTFADKILKVSDKIIKEYPDQSKHIMLYLAIIFDRLVTKNSNLSRYNVMRETIEQVFSRQALQMIWDYPELNPFTRVGWENMEKWVVLVLEHLARMDAKPAIVRHTSATDLPFSDEFFDAVFTDPPYYDNVPYSYLSDFFYVWMKRTIGKQFPDLFSTPLTPKSKEIVAYSNGPDGYEGGKKFFETMLKKSFQEIYRVLKPDGIVVIVYAHKSTEGWETLINSILESGLVVTAAWPIHTQMKSRLRSRKSASLLSAIYMVCRKWKKEPIRSYRTVKNDLKSYLDKKLEQLWNEDIRGADFFIASIGSAIEVYGKYEKVLNDKDKKIEVSALLNDTRTIVTNYAIDKAIQGEFSDKISQMTRFYILWRWAHGEAKVPFDDALKLAQGVGIDIDHEWTKNNGFIRKEQEYVRVLGPDERNLEKPEDFTELIDILHHSLNLWRNQKSEDVDEYLKQKGYKGNDVLERVAQAISESLKDTASLEKDWIDGLLTGFRSGSRRPKSHVNPHDAKKSREQHADITPPDQTKLF